MPGFRHSALLIGMSATLASLAVLAGPDSEAISGQINADNAQSLAEDSIPVIEVIRPFTARYKTRYQLGWFSFDIDADRQLHALPDGHWRLTFNADASIASLRESSEFIVAGAQLQPLEYRYRSSGMIDEPDKTLLFAHPLQQIHDAEKNRLVLDQWQTGIQDNLTYMLQASLDLAQGKTELSYPVFQRNRTKTTDFSVAGYETLNTALGSIKTIRVEQLRDEGKRQITAWFAPDHHYQLVRMTDREKGKLRYRIEIVSLQF